MFTNGRFARLALVLFLTTIAWSGSASAAARWQGDAVYTATNAASGNAVLVFDRDKNGMLMAAGEYATGGLGSGDALGSQGAVILSENGRSLFVVNAGSSPIDAALSKNSRFLYVLSHGTNTISGFAVADNGSLMPIGTVSGLPTSAVGLAAR